MAYKRGVPTFNKGIEPEVKKTIIQNPEGTTTYKTSWSSTKPGSSSSFKSSATKQAAAKPATKQAVTKPATKTSSVSSRSTPAQTVSGEREITTFPNVKAAGMTSQKITAPALPEEIKKPVTKKEIVKNTEKYREDKWLKDNPGKTTEDRAKERAKNIKEAQNKPREKYQSEGSLRAAKRSSKGKGISPCKTC